MNNAQTFGIAVLASTAGIMGAGYFILWSYARICIRRDRRKARRVNLKQRLIESGQFRFATLEEMNNPKGPQYWI